MSSLALVSGNNCFNTLNVTTRRLLDQLIKIVPK